jgi:glutathione S-transferase
MIKLFDNPVSPFARKVRLVLEHKQLPFESIDGLLRSNHDSLKSINGRIEVPALADGDLTVINSSDIVSYLEFRYPHAPVYAISAEARVHARSWERAADTGMTVNVGLGSWLCGNALRTTRGVL